MQINEMSAIMKSKQIISQVRNTKQKRAKKETNRKHK